MYKVTLLKEWRVVTTESKQVFAGCMKRGRLGWNGSLAGKFGGNYDRQFR